MHIPRGLGANLIAKNTQNSLLNRAAKALDAQTPVYDNKARNNSTWRYTCQAN